MEDEALVAMVVVETNECLDKLNGGSFDLVE